MWFLTGKTTAGWVGMDGSVVDFWGNGEPFISLMNLCSIPRKMIPEYTSHIWRNHWILVYDHGDIYVCCMTSDAGTEELIFNLIYSIYADGRSRVIQTVYIILPSLQLTYPLKNIEKWWLENEISHIKWHFWGDNLNFLGCSHSVQWNVGFEIPRS